MKGKRMIRGVMAGLVLLPAIAPPEAKADTFGTYSYGAYSYGADTYADRSCERVRRDTGLTGAIHFNCLRWVEHGNPLHHFLTAKVTHYYCAPLDSATDSRIIDMVDYAANPADCDNPHATLRQ